jgi:hypothetical protein
MNMGARTSDSLQALPMDMDSPPPSQPSQSQTPRPSHEASAGEIRRNKIRRNEIHADEVHRREIRRRRAVPTTLESEGSLESVLWTILFGCGLCIITAGKAIAWLFRSLKRALPGGRSGKDGSGTN